MAVKTKFLRQDFENILSKYNIGEFVKSKPFTEGSVQTNVLIETTKGKFVFRYYETRPKKYILFELDLLKHLGGKKFPSPVPIEDKSGNLLGTHNGKHYVFFSFLQGQHAGNPNTLPFKEQSKEVAKIIARLHKSTEGFKPNYYEVRDFYDPKCCVKTAKHFSKRSKSKKKMEQRLSWLKNELKTLKLPNNLPKGVCHCDTHCSNFLFQKNTLTGLIDFDDASYTWLIYDIANMLYFWAWPPEKDLKFNKAKKLIKEYDKIRKLTATEKRHLFDVLKMVVFMSMSWFVYNDEDYLNEKERIEYLDSLGRDGFYAMLFE
ncbi:MAG: homoserine kinase [Candidatus Uhrbacteria bacterium]|nr:homoserine kinase [Patescibacteria group bacterium]MBU1907000.1 homoserine kinase [Patescibacteria group bacterium]